MNKGLLCALLASTVAVSSAEVFYKEDFGSSWKDNWVQSSWKESEGTRGDFIHTAGKFYNNAEEDKGVQTGQDARFYAYTSKAPKSFTNKGKDLVIQYSVKHEQNIDCGGGYIKVLPSSVNQKDFNGDSDYHIMFGPDICGASTKRVHAILNYKGKNHLIKKTIPCETDVYSHLYTFIIHPDQTYEIQIDQKEVAKGSITEDWDVLEPKQIKDPKSSKPSDWVDAREIADPEDVKPAGHDDIAAQIADPDATKPDDWDDELDGEWEAPQIANPAYTGEWKAKQIPNPAYKGEWVHPLVDNPAYVADNEIYAFSDIGAVGFELWQVKAGTIFNDIIITDNVEEASDFGKKWSTRVSGEKKMKEEQDKKTQEEEEAKRKATEAAEAAAGDDEDEEETATGHDEL